MLKFCVRFFIQLKVYYIVPLCLSPFSSQAQDYTEYYQFIDSAEFYMRSNNISKINECYRKSFSLNRGFPEDYCNAIIYAYFEKKELNYPLIEQGFGNGLVYSDLKSSLNGNKIAFSKKQLKRLYRKKKLKKEKSSFKIVKMLIRDQLSRRLHRNKVHQRDSITSVKLIKLLKTEPELFDRFKTGYVGSELLGILILHSEWKNLESIQDSIHNLTKRGLINRHIFAAIIERSAMGDGYVFGLDSLKTKIVCMEDKKMILCTTYYPNISWFYGEKKDYKRKAILLPPLHPYLTEEKINELRRFLFLSDINLKYNSAGNILLSKDEYCNFK
ncbi:hypothetical protein [Fluviicola taffensis]|uniref:Uncharacterized protein n=1 Tax=Fluviicola taffensis (strain DSM 16823 / NCIMB 13979 / RW262) TaxID=755732 RepID=F2IF11_FLUTR|nr:hypothetical protein [Fluviicola taffensis]AEA42476.1 hypothetical protein Fluta_0470 [Fluviicola taffensis DSM 16823]